MSINQLKKIFKITILMTIVILIFEIIFAIPGVTKFFTSTIENADKKYVFLIVWIIMFLQATVLNIPAYVLLNTCVSIGMNTLTFEYVIVVLSAFMCGCIFSYYLGRCFGVRAVKWCAGNEKDYEKWVIVLNKKGTLGYFLTVLFPFFPDDLLSIVAGAVKFNFGKYVLINFIGKLIGLLTMLSFLELMNFNSKIPIMCIVWFIILIFEIIIYFRLKGKKMNLIVIGKDTDNIALEIWKGNTNYTVLNEVPNVFSKEFLKFIKNRPVIVSTTTDQFEKRNINDVITFLKNHNFIPIFIAEDEHDIVNKMYVGVSDEIINSLQYTKNENNEDYENMIKITQDFLLGKGLIKNENKTLRTPKSRKRPTIKK